MSHVRECQQCGKVYVPANGPCPTCDHGRVEVFACEGVCECGMCPTVDDCPDCKGSGEADKPDVRIVLCEACGSEGTIYSGTGWDGDYLYADRCDTCEGTGGEVINVERITMEDQQLADGTHYLDANGSLQPKATA
jgi:hypothetical protein